MIIIPSWLNPLSWISDKVNQAIFDTINKIATDLLTWAFKLVMDLIMNLNNLSEYFNYSTFLTYSQIVAGSLLVLTIVFEVLKNMSGNIFPDAQEHSLSTYVGRVIFAGFFIFFLPWTVQNIFMEVNNALIGIIETIPSTFKLDSTDVLIKALTGNLQTVSWTFLLIILTIAIAFIILGVMAGIRYIELILCIIIAPVVAVSFVRKGESLSVWVRETASITFTQVIQVLLLKMLTIVIGSTHNPVVLPLIVIGILVVMIRGPQIIRKFLYSTGTGSAAVGAVGGAGRMAAMKFMIK